MMTASFSLRHVDNWDMAERYLGHLMAELIEGLVDFPPFLALMHLGPY